MENASKALIIAGSILVSMIIISLLVLFFNNLRDNMAAQQKEEDIMQAAEFNKQFDSYERDVYGSELLSLANKVYDYNTRESDEKGYSEVTVTIKLNGEKLDLSKKYFKNSTYTVKKINQLKDELDKIKEDLKVYSDRTESKGYIFFNKNKKWSRTIAQLSNMRTTDWIAGLELDLNNTNDRQKYDEINDKISTYNQYKNIESQLKQSEFKLTGSDYDKYTGRITKLEYELK